MRDPLTLFHRRGSEKVPVHRLDFPASGQADPGAFLVYSRKPLDKALFDLPAAGATAERIAKLRAALTRQGGILAVVRYPVLGSYVRIYVEGATQHGFRPPEEILRLQPGYDPVFERLTDEPFDLAAGEHLILPIDQEADHKLRSLLDHLSWLPSDLEATLLNMLRRPSLEGRIEKVEEDLREVQGARASLGERFAGPVSLRAFLATMLVFLLALLAFQWASPGVRRGVRPNGQPSPDTAHGAMNLLFNSLKQTRTSPFTELYSSHFKGFKGRARELPRDSAAVWGVIKLQVLAKEEIDEDLLQGTEKDASPLKVMLSQGNIELDQSEWGMLYYLTCQAFSEACERSCLPSRENDVISRQVLLKDAPDCSDVNGKMAVTALQELNTFVRSQ